MTASLILGGVLGGALCLLVFAIVPPRPALATQAARWERRRARQPLPTGPGAGGNTWPSVAGRWLATRLGRWGITLDRLRGDLDLAGTTLEAHLARKAVYATGGLLGPAVVTAVLMATGTRLPLTVPAAGGVLLAVVLFMVPDSSARRLATQRRGELRRALSCYLDLVAMSLAGGRGVPEALPTAARIGTGWAFGVLESTIDRARLTGETPWAELGALGQRTGIGELADLGAALELVAGDGAKVRQTLTARATAQRQRQLAEAEGAAARANQAMELAQVLLFAGFILFVGFPAVAAVIGI